MKLHLIIILIVNSLSVIGQISSISDDIIDGISIPEHKPTKNIEYYEPLPDIIWRKADSVRKIPRPLNMDSLRHVLFESKEFELKSDSVIYIDSLFVRFINSDSTKHFYAVYDQKGNFENYINVSVVYKEFNAKGQLIKRIGYNKDGEYALLDYSPIEIYKYTSNSRTTEFYNRYNEFTDMTVVRFDDMNRVIEESGYDSKLALHSKTTFKYIDETNEIYEHRFDGNGKLNFSSYDDYAIRYTKMSSDGIYIIEERYYDDQMNLYDSGHNILFDEFSILRQKKTKTGIITSYYNSNNELVFEVLSEE